MGTTMITALITPALQRSSDESIAPFDSGSSPSRRQAFKMNSCTLESSVAAAVPSIE